MRRGLTLLEVMLALAILGGCLAVLGEMIRIGALSASIARDEAKAQLLCESKMAEYAIGALPPEPIGPVAFELETDWEYTVTVEPIDQQELTAVRVRVDQIIDQNNTGYGSHRLASFELVRWIAQPVVVEEEGTLGETSESSSSETGGSSSSGGSSMSGAGEDDG